MRIDIVTIFPEFFAALDVSLVGKAVHNGLLSFGVHNLRDYAFDAHRTVDSPPAGGGAGMVMKAEPWALALEAAIGDADPLVIVPSPAGEVFTQAIAHEIALEESIVFACGRYEGIDQRLIDEMSDTHRVRMLSLGDYVLNGGEVAAFAMIEASVRLIPGVVGNPESLLEESHESLLLEYPSYTQPAQWRGRAIPEVLLSGNHAAIAKWRHDQQIERTKRIRPDLYERFLDQHPDSRD